jgi:hypothetical protein
MEAFVAAHFSAPAFDVAVEFEIDASCVAVARCTAPHTSAVGAAQK